MIVIMSVLFFIIGLLVFDFIIYSIYYRVKFAHSPLDIKTFDGSNQPYHPSVLFFENGWNGYKYWMVVTPYPMHVVYKDRWECPCIYVSNDGIKWEVPAGLNNPIDDLSSEDIDAKNFFSDPHLVYNNGILECWYRITKKSDNDANTILIRKKTVDGISWSSREILADPAESSIKTTLGDMVRSQAVLYNNGKYRMWYVDNKKNVGQRNVCCSESADGISWKNRDICVLGGKDINPWHIDVAKLDGVYYLTIYDLWNLSLWESQDGISYKYKKEILSPSLVYGSFYSDGLYRSSLIKDDSGYKLFFSAFDEKKTSIGLMQGVSLTAMTVCKGKNKSSENINKIYYYNRKRFLSTIKSKFCNNCL